MFRRDRWAAAFVNALGEKAEGGLACLKAFVPPVQAIPGALFGLNAAERLARTLRESGTAAGISGIELEYTIRLISLLVEKNFFRHVDSLIQRIEEMLDKQKGILHVTAESAAPVDGAFEEELRRMIKKRIGAAGIKLKTCLVPELLGGYRLRMGGLCVDASLRGQLEKMTADLAAPAAQAGSVPGGGA